MQYLTLSTRNRTQEYSHSHTLRSISLKLGLGLDLAVTQRPDALPVGSWGAHPRHEAQLSIKPATCTENSTSMQELLR